MIEYKTYQTKIEGNVQKEIDIMHRSGWELVTMTIEPVCSLVTMPIIFNRRWVWKKDHD